MLWGFQVEAAASRKSRSGWCELNEGEWPSETGLKHGCGPVSRSPQAPRRTLDSLCAGSHARADEEQVELTTPLLSSSGSRPWNCLVFTVTFLFGCGIKRELEKKTGKSLHTFLLSENSNIKKVLTKRYNGLSGDSWSLFQRYTILWHGKE